ncbi:hypothetical protein BR93DRAFT_961609 [Coniochaeta sp. PMI_546]|nr:hypothetical protein BR93DRAFT_961609 [Coniochaeta sp. PMI_546]
MMSVIWLGVSLQMLFWATAVAQTVSILDDFDLRRQPDCVKYCMMGGNIHGDIIAALGCGTSRYDSCFCRAEYRSVASHYISSCLTSDVQSCTYPAEYSDAVSIYNRYCSFTGPATVVVVTTETPDNTAANGQVTVTVTTGPTVTVHTSSSSSKTMLPSTLLLLAPVGLVACLSWGMAVMSLHR